MRLSGITPESFVDGPGIRFVIFTQGCPHKCAHCHNPESWDCNGGTDFSAKQVIRLLKKQTKKIRGVTFSGGEPFMQASELTEVAFAVKQLGLDIVTYTGYTYEQLVGTNNIDIIALLSASDLLVDGRYIHEKRDLELPFRGSSNQRLIDVAVSRQCGKAVLRDEIPKNI